VKIMLHSQKKMSACASKSQLEPAGEGER